MWVFEWNGEEFLPAIRDASLVYRQLHSYTFAAQFVEGKTVLDLCAGDGSGADTLARTAANVVAVVVDDRLAAHLSEKYKRPNLKFVTAPGTGAFDVVLCLNTPNDFEFKRFLEPAGLLIVTANEPDNLSASIRVFKNAHLFGQNDLTGSRIWPLDGTPRAPAYALALASDAEIAPPQADHVFLDEASELLNDRNGAIRDLMQNDVCQAKTAEQYQAQLASRTESLAHLQKAVAWQENQIATLNETRDFMGREIGHYRKAFESGEEAIAWRTAQIEDLQRSIQSLQEGLEWRASQVETLTESLDMRAAEVELLNSQVNALQSETARLTPLAHELDSIKASRGWKFVLRLRAIRGWFT
jgi:hypothetical protein